LNPVEYVFQPSIFRPVLTDKVGCETFVQQVKLLLASALFISYQLKAFHLKLRGKLKSRTLKKVWLGQPKIWFGRPKILVVLTLTKCLVDSTKHLVSAKTTKIFGRPNHTVKI
jgi:hypothetical protein